MIITNNATDRVRFVIETLSFKPNVAPVANAIPKLKV